MVQVIPPTRGQVLALFTAWVVFALLHAVFVRFFLYWQIGALDIVMHISGGALFVTTWYAVKRAGLFARYLRRVVFHPLVLLTGAVVAWEVFKYAIGSTVAADYALDTAIDVVAGLGGGLVAFFTFRSRTIHT